MTNRCQLVTCQEPASGWMTLAVTREDRPATVRARVCLECWQPLQTSVGLGQRWGVTAEGTLYPLFVLRPGYWHGWA